jgi:PIN domain nuclease of toxin-antitoxin system
LRLLLDSRIAAWCITDRKRLGPAWTAILSDPENVVFVSSAVQWEFRVKENLGRFEPSPELWVELKRLEFAELPIRSEHADALAGLMNLHKDPFDRIMLAQAKTEGLQFVTADRLLLGYGDFVVAV